MNSANGDSLRSQTLLHSQVFRWVCIACALFITPFAIHHLLAGELLPGLSGLSVAALFLLDFLSLHYRERPLMNREVVLALAAASLCLMVQRLGGQALYWAFPLVITFHFILGRRAALLLNGLFFLTVVALAAPILEPALLLRFAATLFMTSIFAHVFALLVTQQHRVLEQQLITDPLTGAYNRRHMANRIAAYVQRNRRYKHPASLILFDVDHFKAINDSYGHEVGDRVLRILVETIKARIRGMDEIFRYGGEEFVILLPDTSLEQAAKLGQDITDMIAEVRMIEGGPVSISCGIGELMEGEDEDKWVGRCDRALYLAKDRGRGRVCLADDAPGWIDDQITEPHATYAS